MFFIALVLKVDTTDVEKSTVKPENADSKDPDENEEKEQSNLETKVENEVEETESQKDKEVRLLTDRKMTLRF